MSKLKDFLLFIAFSIIVLPVLFFTDIINTKALEIPNKSQLFDHIANEVNIYGSDCDYITIFYNNSTSTWKYYCTTFDLFNSGINNNYISGNRYLDLKNNFYGLSSIRGNRSINLSTDYRMGAYGTYNGNNWVNSCIYSNCQYYYSLDSNDYLVGFFKVTNSYSNGYYVTNRSLSSSLFYLNYNLEYYETPVDYFGTYTNYFSEPDNVKGSTLDLNGNELSGTILDFSYGYINSYMYDFTDIDNEDTLISHQFNYNSLDLNGNFKLGMVVTSKKYIDSGIIVHAVTNTGTWACNSITPLKSKYDINYQYYVECPSVNFDNTDDDYLSIVVNGSNEYYAPVGPFPWYDTNYLFNNANNNKYVGISSILRTTTDTPPVPVEPDTPSEPSINESIDNMNNNIMDTTGPDTSSLANSAGWLPAGPVDSIINLPITMLQSLTNVFSNTSCSPVSIPIPFINYNYSLPCINTIISNMGFSTWWELVGTIASAFILYKYLINLYAWVDNTLTFRENNWNDWGGI